MVAFRENPELVRRTVKEHHDLVEGHGAVIEGEADIIGHCRHSSLPSPRQRGSLAARPPQVQVGISLFRRHPPLEYHAACAGHSLELAVAIGGTAEIGRPEWPRPKRRG